MKSFFECIPCFLNQTLSAVRNISDDENLHGEIMKSVIRLVSELDMHDSPPATAQKIHRIIREQIKNPDPYRENKIKYNSLAGLLIPGLLEKLKGSANPFELRLRLAIAGNIIDFGKGSGVNEDEVISCLENSINAPLDTATVEKLRKRINTSNDILYLGDNCGEIVFDKLLIEHLPFEKITYVVRGSPVINDVTMDDAEQVGMHEIVSVIDNGSDAPGTILSDCSMTFQNRFESADLIIAKGQGNYETLSETRGDIFFLLQAKCPVIARDIGCQVGDFIISNAYT